MHDARPPKASWNSRVLADPLVVRSPPLEALEDLARFSRQNFPQRMHNLRLLSKPYSAHPIHDSAERNTISWT